MGNDFDEEYYLTAYPDVVMAIRSGFCKTGWEHYVRFGRAEGRSPTPPGTAVDPRTRTHRRAALRFLRGQGIEVGALQHPCPVPEGCDVVYYDRVTDDEEARRIYPEVEDADLQPVDRQLDLAKNGLGEFSDASLDFVILNQVIQQLGNPIRCVEEVFRVLRPGGHAVLSAPDKRFGVDGQRAITGWDHLLRDYLMKATDASDAHFVDIIALFYPGDFTLGVTAVEPRLKDIRLRENAHVWDTEAFRDFLDCAMKLCEVDAACVYEADGEATRLEYFGIFEKKK